jgi:methionine-rich copper-binding protein CopC
MKKRTSLVCFLIFTLCIFYTAIPNTVFGQEEDVSLAQKVYDRYKETLLREDVQSLLPDVLTALSDPATLENPLIAQLGGFDAAVDLLLNSPVLIRQVVPTASDEVVALIGTEPIQIMFKDPDVRTLMQDAEAVKELAALLEAVGTTPPTDGETPPTDGETPPTDGETPPTDGETPPTDGETPPTDGETPPTEDGEVAPPPPIEQANPFDPIMPTNEALLGKSRLGGLSINSISGRKFLSDLLLTATGFSTAELAALSGQTQDQLVEMIVQVIPKEVPFTKKQIQAFLESDHLPIFAGEIDGSLAQGLDAENFGNAITPMLLDLIYDDGMGDRTDPNRKYLTRNSLSLYVRVPLPSANVGGVKFSSSDGTLQEEGQLVGDPTVLGGEFISYTFRLEEALAATNLPSWPALEDELEQLFKNVTLYHSDNGLNGRYTGYPMQPTFGPNGVVWETTIDVTQGNSFYYYHVELAHSLMLKTLDREVLAELFKEASGGGAIPTVSDILYATKTYSITQWSMPDPRNLQLADRGILKALFDADFRAALGSSVGPLLASGALPTAQELFNALGKDRLKLQNILLRNAEKVTMRFEEAFDPMLSSVFSIPKVDPESESLWVAELDNIPDGNYFLGAVVHDANGNPLDLMQGEFTVDTEAPEADVVISKGENTTVYRNNDGVYVAATSDAGTATLKVTGMPTRGYVGQPIHDQNFNQGGYLLYQIVGLNPDGTPYMGDSSLQRPNTWMPLTPEATMLASTLWEQAIAQLVRQGALPEELDLSAAGIGVMPTENLTLDFVNTVLPVLATPLGLGLIENDPTLGPALKGVSDFLGQDLLDPKVINLLVEVFGATVELINHIPITYGDPNNDVMMLAQLGEDVFTGDYGIRALGIDTLFNISSHTAPTQLRIVDSSDPVHRDRASVTFAVIGDCNMDGDMDDLFESGPIGDVTIFGNTTENVVLTVTVDHRSVHPAAVMVQYAMDAAGPWQNIGTLDLAGYETGDTLTIPWNVTDFDALVAAGDSVMVRAVAANALELADLEPMTGVINLDAGICPLDPEVIAITVDPATTTNANSGAPQGMLTINAYTPSRTSTPIGSVRLAAKGPQDAEWSIETSEAVEGIGGQELADLLGDLVSTVGPDKPVLNIDSTYQKWSVTVDTTTLADTITAGTDENQYVVTGSAYDANGTELLPPIDGVEAKFSVDNIDITNITAVADADGAVEANEDGSYSVGGLVDKYDDTVESPMVTLTIEPVSYRGSYTSVMLVTDAEGASIEEATETAEGSGVFEITVDVGILADGEYLENGTYMFHAAAVDAEGAEVPETDGAKISVNVENTYRPAPEVLALAVDPESITQTNPDSGAPQGTITLHAYSHEISSPATKAVRIIVKRPGDEEWIDIGMGTESKPTTEIPDAALADFVGHLANAATDTPVVPINRTSQMWAIEVDTTALDDTITVESAAARDASQDDNQYVVRAIPIEEAEDFEDPEASPNATAMFSVDNDDDVPPEGPTNIVAVADVAGPITANEDGSYTVGGIVDDTVPSPIAVFTTEQDADVDPITYERGSVNLVQTTEDGTETITEGEAGVLDTITIDVGLLENGTYMFHALTVDEFGNVQTDESQMITVHVLNIRVSDISEPVVIAVDGTDVPEPPAEPIPLRESVTVSFMVANGSLAADELSGSVDGSEVPSESAEDPENTFSLKVEVGALVDGVYTPDGVITKRNGSVAFPLTTVNVDNTGPMVTVESPTEDETVDSLPTIRATYHDGLGAGVDGATGSLALARLQPPNEAEIVVDQADLDKDAASLVYTRSEPLAGGAYRVTVQVADSLGNVGEGSAEFAVNGTAPMVAIHSPASGQTFEHGEPLISGEFSGAGAVEVTTFTINDVEATPEVDGNRFSYTPEEGLGNGNHTVVVAVTDGDGNTAQTSVTFTVEMPRDTTPPVISAAAPNGIIKDTDPDKLGAVVISAVVTDEQSAISSVKYSINGGVSRSVATLNVAEGKIQAPVDFETHGPGLYSVQLSATSQGGTTEHRWTFTLVLDNVKPTITSITPSGTFRGGLPVISASASDESGIANITIAVRDAAGEEVKGETADDGEDNVEGITRLDFNPEAPLDEGTYTIEVRATDTLGNSTSAKENFTIDFDTAAPVITMASPQNEARLTNRRPQISITYADAESGVDVDSIRFVFDDKLINLAPNQKSASQVMYTPPADLAFGQHTVKLEVSDMAHKEGNVSEKNEGARKANMAVYEFSFTVESEEGPVLASRPINAPNPFKENTRISFTLTRQSTVSIVIYDSTLRPVRVLVDNEVWGAGEYTGKAAIGWDGTSTSGEDLARGIYFCQIIVAEGFEPEYVILKLALTR